MAIALNTPDLSIFGAKRVNDFIQLIRKSILPRKECRMLANMDIHASGGIIREILPHRDTWAIWCREFRVRTHFEWGDLIETSNVRRTRAIAMLWEPGQCPRQRNGALALTIERGDKLRLLWNSTEWCAGDNQPPDAGDDFNSGTDGICVVNMIRAELIAIAHCAVNGRMLLGPLTYRRTSQISHRRLKPMASPSAGRPPL